MEISISKSNKDLMLWVAKHIIALGIAIGALFIGREVRGGSIMSLIVATFIVWTTAAIMSRRNEEFSSAFLLSAAVLFVYTVIQAVSQNLLFSYERYDHYSLENIYRSIDHQWDVRVGHVIGCILLFSIGGIGYDIREGWDPRRLTILELLLPMIASVVILSLTIGWIL